MSYILDALKKADAERERSAVPGLHAHPQDGLADAARGVRGMPWPALAVVAIVVLGGALAWVLLSDGGERMPPLVAEAPPAATAPPAAAPAPLPAPAPAPVAGATPAPAAPPVAAAQTPAAAPPLAAPPTAPPPATRAPAPAAVTRPAAAPRPAPELRPPAPAPVRPAPAPAAPPATAAAETRVPWLNELPAPVRAGLPPLAISGAVYSPTASARMLFVNGQVLREGQATVEGVVVERIGAWSSELSAHGQRFQVRH